MIVSAQASEVVRAGSLDSPTGPITLLVVIVNYRSAALAIDCLRSLEPEIQARGEAHVAIIENQSGADQYATLRAAIDDHGWHGWVTLIQAERNGGFAAGNNVAIDWAMTWPSPPDLVWLLNPDTYLRPGALGALETFLVDHTEVGLVGSRLESPDGSPQNSAFRFPTILGELVEGAQFGLLSRLMRSRVVVLPLVHEAAPVDWVAGASLMIRRRVLDQVGALDDGFFMYYEEVDFCRRARDAGWTCWYLPASRVVHLVGQSSDVTNYANFRKRRPGYWFDARQRYFRKNHGLVGASLANLLHISSFALYRLRSWRRRHLDNNPEHFLADLIRSSFRAVPR